MTIDLRNRPININHCMYMVTCLPSNHYEELCSCISTFHSTWQIVRNQPPAQVKDIQVVGHIGKDMTSTKVVMVGLKCSTLHRFENKGHYRPVQWKCLQNRRKTIQSIGQDLPALIVHLNLFPAHLGDPRFASQQQDSSHQRNCRKQISQGLQTCLHCSRCLMRITMQLMRVTIRRTWVVQKADS